MVTQNQLAQLTNKIVQGHKLVETNLFGSCADIIINFHTRYRNKIGNLSLNFVPNALEETIAFKPFVINHFFD